MDDDKDQLVLEIALALRETRLYWAPSREPLTLADKQEVARRILAHLRASSVTWTVTRGARTRSAAGRAFMR
jgi:hypothetical protein